MIKLTNPFKNTKQPARTIPFTFKYSEQTREKLVFLKKHLGTSKTAVLEDLIDAGYEAAKKRK